MKPTKWKCRFMIQGTHYERRIYIDKDGDWFIRYNGRYYEYEDFTTKHYCSRWEEIGCVK